MTGVTGNEIVYYKRAVLAQIKCQLCMQLMVRLIV